VNVIWRLSQNVGQQESPVWLDRNYDGSFGGAAESTGVVASVPASRGRSDYQVFRGTRHFASLDALRCLSVLAVIWHHASVHTYLFTSRGYRGVDLFFAISGFLITTLLLREKDRFGKISLRDFYMRRSLRIFPLFYAVLLLYTVLVWFAEKDPEVSRGFWHNLPYFATYTSNWFVNLTGGHVIFYFAWSLAAEEQFYFVWPWVERFMNAAVAAGTMVGVIVLVLLVRLGACEGVLGKTSPLNTIFDNIPLAICFGVLVAHMLHHERGYRWARRVLGYRWCSVAALALVLVMCAVPDSCGKLDVAVPMALLVATCVIREDHWLAPLMRWRVLVHCGTVSYGVYLMHMLAHNAVERVLTSMHMDYLAVNYVLTTCVAVGGASVSFYTYERFFLKFKAKFSR
jgi:peptidoglycan/LPS O-acetylase OafA/YrhL